jgi:hypothetical protein
VSARHLYALCEVDVEEGEVIQPFIRRAKLQRLCSTTHSVALRPASGCAI